MLRSITWVLLAIILSLSVAWFVRSIREPLKKELTIEKDKTLAVQAARTVEKELIKDDVAISKAYQEGLKNGKKDLDRVLGVLNAERLRYRSRANFITSMPSASSPASRCYGEEVADIYDEMARLASEADEVTKQLNSAQELLKNR